MLYRWWRQRLCRHDWTPIDGNAFKRCCHQCGRVEWLYWRKYPAAGEPAYLWEDMTLPASTKVRSKK